MLLVAGGQLDPNIGALLRRVLQRNIPFRDLLVGPEHVPRVTVDLTSGVLTMNGEEIAPDGCFIRHDVFLHQKTGSSTDHVAALNWFYALRGWGMGRPEIRLFNRHSYLSENNKIENLRIAESLGFKVPRTIVTNDFAVAPPNPEMWIQKPVAGGAYTTSLPEFLATNDQKEKSYPRFIQRLILLGHKVRRLDAGAAQQGHRGRAMTRTAINRRRIVAIEFGTCRSGRSGGASGSMTAGKRRCREALGGTRS